ncbi:MAG: GNAT family N-acetyltransferase [Acidobacteriota bacterium]
MAGPCYRLVTSRLVVRCWDPRDAPLLQAAIAESMDHLRDRRWIQQEPQTVDEKIELLRRFRGRFDQDQDYVYGIFSRDERDVIGSTGLHVRAGAGAREIGYWIRASRIGQGLASEAAGALTRVGFEVDGLDRIEIHCGPHNTRSARVAEKLGYAHEATLRRRLRQPDGALRDTMVWTLFADRYRASPAAQLAITAFDAVGRQLI